MFKPRLTRNCKRSESMIPLETLERIKTYASDPELIERRIRQLDEEWDVDRLIETQAPPMTLLGLALGTFVNRKWLVLPAAVQAAVLARAILGYYPLMPLFRLLGVRSEKEIAYERYVLKALRGDFVRPQGDGQGNGEKAQWAFTAARLSNL